MFPRLRAALRSAGVFVGVTREQGLVTALGDSSPSVRWSARQILGGSDPKVVGPWLVEAISTSPDPFVRRGAVDALRWAITPIAAWRATRDPNALVALPVFLRILEEENDREMLIPAIDGLGVFGEQAKEHADVLQRFLRDPDKKIRAEAEESLEMVGIGEGDVLARMMIEEQAEHLGGAPAEPGASAPAIEEPWDPALDRAVEAEDRGGGGAVTARLVYADWLQSRGHPRGELIALQQARAESAGDVPRANEIERAIRRLFRRHRRSLLPAVPLPFGWRLQWRAGFLDEIDAPENGKPLKSLLRHRAARFVRAVRVEGVEIKLPRRA